MLKLHPIVFAGALSLMALTCADAPSQNGTSPSTEAASGAKYGDDAFMFWTKGDEAMVERFGESFLSGCRVVD